MLKLVRKRFTKDGIFGELLEEDGKFICDTLEHAYQDTTDNIDSAFYPKLPDGSYTCVLGPHRLASMKNNFQTYEIKNVPGHTGILFHAGNTNEDSNGCVLVGVLGHNEDCLYMSRKTFGIFMAYLQGIKEFQLQVSSV